MSMKFAKSFNFMKSDTFFHKLDPRAKGIMIICFMILVFLFNNLIPFILLILLLIPFIIVSKTIENILMGLKGLKFIFLFILLLNSYIFSFNLALIVILRIFIFMIIFSLYFQTTLPEDLTQSLISIRTPYPIAFALSLSFRFIPTMARETEIITEAQLSRGHKIEEGGFINQIKNLFPLLIPLLMNSIRRAFHVAEALETRAFGINKRPTFYIPLKFKFKDWIFVVGNILLLVLGILIKTNNDVFPQWLNWNLSL